MTTSSLPLLAAAQLLTPPRPPTLREFNLAGDLICKPGTTLSLEPSIFQWHVRPEVGLRVEYVAVPAARLHHPFAENLTAQPRRPQTR